MLVSFAKMDQMNIMFALFLLLVVTVYIHPSMVKKLNHTILGRLIIVAIIVYFSAHNTTAGILATLVIICAMQRYIYQEGFDDASKNTNATNTNNTTVENVGADSLEQDSMIDKSKVEDLKIKMNATTDQLTSQEEIQSVNSNSLPTPPSSGNDNEVTPSGKETFQTLGFSAY